MIKNTQASSEPNEALNDNEGFKDSSQNLKNP